MNVITDKEIKHAYENPQWLKDNYPKAFESELEVGKWYKLKDSNFLKFLVKHNSLNDNDGYGFSRKGFWSDGNFGLNNVELATSQEVENALKNEIWKRFKVGNKVKFINGTKSKIKGKILTFDIENNIVLLGDSNNRFEIFNNGVWAEIIPKEETYIKIPLRYIQDTKDDKELACLVRNIAENY